MAFSSVINSGGTSHHRNKVYKIDPAHRLGLELQRSPASKQHKKNFGRGVNTNDNTRTTSLYRRNFTSSTQSVKTIL